MLERFNPDIYSDRDAKHALSKIKDKEYSLGETNIVPENILNKAKIWSLPPGVLEKVKNLVDDAGHFHIFPFVMGTYEMDSQKMRMNDISFSDPITIGLTVTGGFEAFSLPLRGMYFVGRRNWWRHESIHARHHFQMANFLEARDQKKKSYGYSRDSVGSSRMGEAAETIHESGIEELLTRWQSYKESRGIREKTVASAAMLFYLEYTSFTGIRNMFIDAKEATLDHIPEGKVRIPAKTAALLTIAGAPLLLDGETNWIGVTSEVIDAISPVTAGLAENMIWRGLAYIDIAALSSLFSSKEKGALGGQKSEADQGMSTREYKFPYAYNPATSISRSVRLSLYLSRVWDQIPNYRVIKSPKAAEALKREIEGRVTGNLGERQAAFTMNVVDNALRSVQNAKRSAFPQEVYVKGMFIPAMYLKLRELYGGEQNSTG